MGVNSVDGLVKPAEYVPFCELDKADRKSTVLGDEVQIVELCAAA
ncbi:hypothetical protein [Sorangium sp. So ce1024]